jgi:hypothetical protein
MIDILSFAYLKSESYIFNFFHILLSQRNSFRNIELFTKKEMKDI